MKESSLKSKTIISICCFVAVFVALMLVAAFCDFDISKIMTKGSLEKGEYISHGFFPVAGEVFGTTPIYIVAALCMGITFWIFLKVVKNKPIQIIGAIVAAALAVLAWWFFFKDIVGYLFEHAGNQAGSVAGYADVYEFRHAGGVRVVEVLMALVVATLTVFAFKGIKEEHLKKLGWMVLAIVIAAAVANLLVMIIKKPVGRMRFRAINSDLGQAFINGGQVKGYTPWYIANGQPSKDIINAFVANYPGSSDAFQSFPSGHTCSASMSYALIMLPYAIDFKRKKLAKVLCWTCPIVITALVAIARIVAGAHYMSDVTMGGTIGFVCMIIMMEIFVCRGEHFFALFPKARKQKAVVAAEPSENVEEPQPETQDAPITENEMVEAEQASDINTAQKEVSGLMDETQL